jgi:23S rRNA pseudouridine1911/1915/1917 synthase
MSEDLSSEPIEIEVPEEVNKQRVDAFLAERFEKYSRSLLRRAIVEGTVTVNGELVKPSFKLHPGQLISIRLPEIPVEGPVPEDIPLDILFEDDFMVVVNKPPAMVVHPARGNWSGTLTAALAFHFDQLSQVAGVTRPGIVHRLDRDTSGAIMVAKTDTAHQGLAAQFEARTIKKSYLAIVRGTPSRDAEVVEAPIGHHPYQREKMSVRADDESSKAARTVFHVQERLGKFSLLRAEPTTGRTHQIRVHAAHIGHPVFCDKLYSGRSQILRGELAKDGSEEVLLGRQALHAWRLELKHPISGEPVKFEAPLPTDIQQTLDVLRELAASTTKRK